MYASQVTNPAIDPLREGLVMSLEVNLGKRGNILEVGPENASQVCFFPTYLTVFYFFLVSSSNMVLSFFMGGTFSPLMLGLVLYIFLISTRCFCQVLCLMKETSRP